MFMNFQSIKDQMISFLKNETNKIGINNVVVGISGGLDSAIVSVLAKEAFGDNMQGVMMPSHLSSVASIKDAQELCSKFDIKYKVVEIAPMVKGYFDNVQDATPLRIGNFSARIRMTVLYDISASNNAIVIGTSNRSEILLGYGTLYGDTACAINPIGQIYKSDLFEFAKFLSIPQSIIDKKPSADLWEGQSDEEELGYSYKTMDNVLKKLIDQNTPKEELIKQGVEKELIDMLEYRVKTNAFKCKLPTIAQISLDN
jgi:NAD+ synthase